MENTFIKVGSVKYIGGLLKEAKRVGYNVEKSDLVFSVKDGESLVFKGVRVQKEFWACTFSKDYWKEA